MATNVGQKQAISKHLHKKRCNQISDRTVSGFIYGNILIISRMNHEIALCMLAYRADFRSLLAYHDMTAV